MAELYIAAGLWVATGIAMIVKFSRNNPGIWTSDRRGMVLGVTPICLLGGPIWWAVWGSRQFYLRTRQSSRQQ